MTPVIAPNLKHTSRARTAQIASLENLKILEGTENCPVEEPPAPLAPLKSSAPKFRRKLASAEVLSEPCLVAVQQVLHYWAVVLRSDDPEGPHQMRVGLRRLRSALKAFRPVIDNDNLRDVDQQARNLGCVLSELRDADVLVTDIVDAVLAKHEGDPDLLSLKMALAETLVGHRQHVRNVLARDEWSVFRLQLLALPEEVGRLLSKNVRRSGRGDLKWLAGRALAKRWRRVAKAGRNLDQLNITERHELRKELKVLRYTTELFSSLYPQKIVRQFLAKLRRLQDGFGYLNDVTVADKLTSMSQDSAIGTPDMQRAVGYVIGWHIAHAEDAWREIGEEWREVSRAPKFWLG